MQISLFRSVIILRLPPRYFLYSGDLQIPELSELTRLMGGDPFVVAMNLQEVINNKKLDKIIRREAKSRIDAFNVTKDPDTIKAIRPKYLDG